MALWAGSSLFAQHGWVVVMYTNNTTAYGLVTINGSPASAGDVVGAFVGGECRAFQEVIINSGSAYVTLLIQGETIETVSFKVWDSSANEILNVSYTTQTNPGYTIGSYPNLLPIAATGSSSAALFVTPDTRNVPSATGSTTFNVSNSGGGSMAWTAVVTTGSSWAHITSGSSGTNSGTISINVDENVNNTQRTANVTVTASGATGSPKVVTVIQEANVPTPILSVTPDSRNVAYTAGTTTFTISNSGGGSMGWIAEVTSGSSWARITSGSSGTNSGTITITVDANAGNSQRTANITVTASGATGSPKVVTVVQEANVPTPVLSVTPDSRSLTYTAGSTTFTVSNSGGGSMGWTAVVTSGSSWVHITSGSSGTNSGTITMTVDANPTNTQRTANITVTASGATGSPKVVTVVQEANVPTPVLSVTPDSRSLPYTAGSTTFTVSNSGGGSMGWTAVVTSGSSWVHITSGSSGTNSGTITMTVDENPTNTQRTANITVTASGATGSPKVIAVIQEGNLPNKVLSVTPDSRDVAFVGGTTTFTVSNSGIGSMIWEAEVAYPGNSWASIISGSSGTNLGTITVTFTDNSECSTRTANIIISAAGATGSPKIVTIEQAPNSTSILTVLPESRQLTNTDGTTMFAVFHGGCGTMPWSATITDGGNWLSITSGSYGTDNGVINLAYTYNPDCVIRSAVITLTAAGAIGSPKELQLIQAATTSPVLLITPGILNVTRSGGSALFDVAILGCGNIYWVSEIISNSPWIRITSGLTGTNNGEITCSIDENKLATIRTATIRVTTTTGTQDVSVEQGGTGISDYEFNHKVKVYPNPTSGLISIQIDNAVFSGTNYIVFDLIGKILLKGKIDQNISQLDLSQLSKGPYFLKVYNSSGEYSLGIVIRE